MNPYLFWLLVAAMVLFLQLINKMFEYKTSAKFWKDTAFEATERYNDLLVKKSMNQAIKNLEKIKI